MEKGTAIPETQRHAVIIGAGFAGLNCALKLASDTDLRITLIDKNNYQQFQPLLYQVATGLLSPDDAAFNLRDVFLHHKNVQVVMSEIESVDLATRSAKGKEGNMYMGQKVLITAAGSGIGLEIARAFSKAGATVFITDINQQALDAATKEIPGLLSTLCNNGKRADIEKMVPAAVEALGGLVLKPTSRSRTMRRSVRRGWLSSRLARL